MLKKQWHKISNARKIEPCTEKEEKMGAMDIGIIQKIRQSKKWMLGAMFPILAGIGYLTYDNHKNFKETIMRQAQTEMLLTAKTTAHTIDTYLKNDIMDLKQLTDTRPVLEDVLEKKESDEEHCPFKALHEKHKPDSESIIVVDPQGYGICVCSPHLGIIGQKTDSKIELNLENLANETKAECGFDKISGYFGINLYRRMWLKDKHIADIKWTINMNYLCRHVLQPIQVGNDGFMVLLNSQGDIFHHQKSEFAGKNIVLLNSMNTHEKHNPENYNRKNNKEKQSDKDALAKILSGSEGTAIVDLPGLFNEKLCIAWTYVSVNSLASGAVNVKARNDSCLPEYKLVRRAVAIAGEIDRAIPKSDNLIDEKYLTGLIAKVLQKYPDLAQISIHGPRTIADSALVCKASTNPGMAGRLSGMEYKKVVDEGLPDLDLGLDLSARSHNAYGLDANAKATGTIEAILPIYTSDIIFPLIFAKPYSEINNPIKQNFAKTLGLSGILFVLCGMAGVLYYKNQNKNSQIEAEKKYANELAITANNLRELAGRLQESEDYLKSVWKNNPAGMVVIDSGNNKIIDINPSATKMLGYSLESVVGRICFDNMCDKEICSCADKAIVQNGELLQSELINSRGERIPVLISTVPIVRNGQDYKLECFIDFRKEKALQEKLRLSELEMKDLMYIASHDLQVPIISIRGFAAELIKEHGDKLGEEGRYDIERIDANSKRLHRLVLSLLDISRLNTVDHPMLEFDPRQVVAEVISDNAFCEGASKANFEIGDMPLMYGDKQRVAMIYRNLLSNSVKYNGKNIYCGYDAANGAYFVKDDGIGIMEGHLENIFKPGVRLKQIKAEGDGMGLAFCKKAVGKYGGKIWAESEGEGKGAAIYFRLGDKR